MAQPVQTLREGLNVVLGAQTTIAAVPAMPASVEEIFTRVNRRLERLESVVVHLGVN